MSVTFSGDLGRPNDPILQAPAPPAATDFFVCESTYGDRTHPIVDAEVELAECLTPALARGAVVAVPAFAIGRAQSLLLQIARLKHKGHADATEILAWLRQLPRPPRRTFITHGEPGSSDALRQRIERQLNWSAFVPEYRQTVELTAQDGV